MIWLLLPTPLTRPTDTQSLGTGSEVVWGVFKRFTSNWYRIRTAARGVNGEKLYTAGISTATVCRAGTSNSRFAGRSGGIAHTIVGGKRGFTPSLGRTIDATFKATGCARATLGFDSATDGPSTRTVYSPGSRTRSIVGSPDFP